MTVVLLKITKYGTVILESLLGIRIRIIRQRYGSGSCSIQYNWIWGSMSKNDQFIVMAGTGLDLQLRTLVGTRHTCVLCAGTRRSGACCSWQSATSSPLRFSSTGNAPCSRTPPPSMAARSPSKSEVDTPTGCRPLPPPLENISRGPTFGILSLSSQSRTSRLQGYRVQEYRLPPLPPLF